MIEFEQVHLQNFLSFQDVTLDLSQRGLVLVKGINEDEAGADSNDAGKSNLFSGITWILFERLAKTHIVPGDAVVRKGCKNCVGSLTWRDGKRRFQVVRYRKHVINGDSVALFENNVSRKAANEEIVKALGMTYDMFLWSVFWAQSTSSRRLTELRDSDFKELFDELIRTEHYETKRKAVGKRLEKVQNEIASIQREEDVTTGSLQAIDTEIQEVSAEIEKYKGVKVKQAEALLKKWREAKKDAEDSEALLEQDANAVHRLNKELRLVKLAYEDKANEYRTMSAGFKKKRCETCKQSLQTKAAVSQVEQVLRAIREKGLELKERHGELARTFSEAKKQYDHTDQKTREFQDRYATFGKRLADILLLSGIPAQDGFDGLDQAFALISTRKGRLRALEGKKTAFLADLGTLKSRISALGMREAGYRILDRAYGPAGLRTLRLAKLTPFLNRYAAEFSSRLVEGALTVKFSTTTKLKGGEIREKYRIDVFRDPEVSFVLSGGGMKRRADLIAAFALDKLRQKLTAKNVNLRIYDEATDGVDAAGEDAVLQVLREDCKGTTMFVSHKAFVDATAFDSIITVRKSDGVSRLED